MNTTELTPEVLDELEHWLRNTGWVSEYRRELTLRVIAAARERDKFENTLAKRAQIEERILDEMAQRIEALETALLKVMERGHEWSDCPQNARHAARCSCCIAIAAVGKGGAG